MYPDLVPLIFLLYSVLVLTSELTISRRFVSEIMVPFEIHLPCLEKLRVRQEHEFILYNRRCIWSLFSP